MKLKENFFLKKKILIYGLGKSGSACFDFLNRNNDILVFDDNSSDKTYAHSLKTIKKMDEVVESLFVRAKQIQTA